MKIREVIDIILAYHPFIMDYHGCDDYKCGDPEAECTGIVTALTPNIQVIRRAIELGANLIVVHEPTFYTSADQNGWFEDFPNAVYDEKRALLDEHGIVVWRDHDHLHFHNPDGIFTGVLRYMGWEERAAVKHPKGAPFSHFIIDIDPMSVEELANSLITKIGLNGARFIGRGGDIVRKVALVGHLYPMGPSSQPEYSVQVIRELEEGCDVIIPGETIDWTVLSYVRDAVLLGKTKAMISIGHYNWEELGMRYAKDWLEELVPGIAVTYVPSGDMYQYIKA